MKVAGAAVWWYSWCIGNTQPRTHLRYLLDLRVRVRVRHQLELCRVRVRVRVWVRVRVSF